MSDKPSATQVATFLRSYKGQLLPPEVFYAIAETMALPYVELVIFKASSQHQQVLLTKREDDDPYFPGKWHVPGTLLRSTDVTFRGDDLSLAVKRLTDEELQGLEISHLSFSGFHFHKVARGVGLSLVLVALATEEPKIGQYFYVNHLPENIIPEQAVFILKTARSDKPWEPHLR